MRDFLALCARRIISAIPTQGSIVLENGEVGTEYFSLCEQCGTVMHEVIDPLGYTVDPPGSPDCDCDEHPGHYMEGVEPWDTEKVEQAYERIRNHPNLNKGPMFSCDRADCPNESVCGQGCCHG